MAEFSINIDRLIDIVSRGGTVKTGVDVRNDKGVLLLEKSVPIHSVNPLLVVKKYGGNTLPIDFSTSGGVWDKAGNPVSFSAENTIIKENPEKSLPESIERKIKEINRKKAEASEKYECAKKNIKKVILEIKNSGGEFDTGPVEDTVTDIVNFLAQDDTAFSHMTREIFSYDDYLYNHSVSTCAIGTSALIRFNEKFSEIINNHLSTISIDTINSNGDGNHPASSFVYYLPQDIHDISLGYFLHDVGKVLIPENILNKQGKLSEAEFDIVKKHSYEKGMEILSRNKLDNPFISNCVKYHHGVLFQGEKGCYPTNLHPIEMPPYVKICKLSDIYDAMTSKRSYKDAFNPVGVVTEIFRKYANQDRMLQFILRAFVKAVGIYPPGSVLNLTNGQMVYVLDSDGPMVIPFTDKEGTPLFHKSDPIKIGESDENPENKLEIDRRHPLKSPIEVWDSLPEYLKVSVE
ncbi:MAG: HD domain-containing protein [Proteobacteria bacterium]|nr:HD domain-containing protein [Pseudomonadota bacterium]MBU4468994.1 HD domain-containing protein [Pseudomonadota bacterium]MCG2750933.1 HD domain-containing protein [Desulfobacteraceae bacterium]